MNLDHPNFGQQYRLSRMAARLRTFTVSELIRLAGIGENTIYSFISKLARLPQNYLLTEAIPTATRGRPRNRYTLTETGVDYLLQRNARIASILAAERSSSTVGSVVPPVVPVAERAFTAVPTSAVAMVRAKVPAQAEAAPKYAAGASEPKRTVSMNTG
jgi:hypothetical protein